MPWMKITDPVTGKTITAHVRMSKTRCKQCGVPSDDHRLCDFKMPDGKDCDKRCCRYCASSPEPGRDFCWDHR